MIKKKVLVVDDSAFMRKLITEILSSSDKLEVVGIARNGKDAVEKVNKLKPDVVTLDVEMPEMNGIEALKHIMEQHPVPVVMLSSTTTEGTENTLTAIQLGAVDFIMKPSGTISLDLHKIREEIIMKVEHASQISIEKLNFNRELAVKKNGIRPTSEPPRRVEREIVYKSDYHTVQWGKHEPKLICIGTSTGGPRALQEVLTALPESVGAPILIVQHMPKGFTKSLALRLNALSKIVVKEAEHGEILKEDVAYIAPGDFHLKVKKVGQHLVAQLDQDEPARNGHRPSVDVMFESVSLVTNFNKIIVIMTGMGSDGTKGLVKLKESGKVRAIAESKDSCIVFGMPKAAIETNLIDHVDRVEHIAHSIMKCML